MDLLVNLQEQMVKEIIKFAQIESRETEIWIDSMNIDKQTGEVEIHYYDNDKKQHFTFYHDYNKNIGWLKLQHSPEDELAFSWGEWVTKEVEQTA